VLVGLHGTRQVALVADNPGLWMLHCHVLIHAASGPGTMLSYVDISNLCNMGQDRATYRNKQTFKNTKQNLSLRLRFCFVFLIDFMKGWPGEYLEPDVPARPAGR
jgi:Multicopper oxidase